MTILSKIKRTPFIFLLLISSNLLFGQKLEPKKRITAPNHIISSQVTERAYQRYISLPLSYSIKDPISSPVLQFTKNKTGDLKPTKVFISVGQKEAIPVVLARAKFSAGLQNAAAENIDLNWKIVDNKNTCLGHSCLPKRSNNRVV